MEDLQGPDLSQVKAGDVLIAPEHHTEFAYTADRWYSAHIDESGGATGGQAGNQPGSETKFREAYDRSGGWTYLARPPADTADDRRRHVQSLFHSG